MNTKRLAFSPSFVIPASRQRGSIRKDLKMDTRYKLSGMTKFSVIPAGMKRGSIRKIPRWIPDTESLG